MSKKRSKIPTTMREARAVYRRAGMTPRAGTLCDGEGRGCLLGAWAVANGLHDKQYPSLTLPSKMRLVTLWVEHVENGFDRGFKGGARGETYSEAREARAGLGWLRRSSLFRTSFRIGFLLGKEST